MLVLAAGLVAVSVHAAAGSGQPACASLRLRTGPGWPEKTGQHSATFVVTNTSAERCAFDGYPRIELLDRRSRVLRFTYRRGGDQMITSQPPRRVIAQPSGRVYFAVNKYRCDVRSTALASAIKVQLPGSATWRRLALPAYPVLDFCGSAAPSGVVSISPFVASLPDAAAGP